MLKLNSKHRKIALAVILAICFVIIIVVSLAVFTDRVSHQTNFTTASFSADGYTLKRVAPDDPFVAGEDVAVTLKESNTGDTAVKSVITMTTKWTSPDTALSIFGNDEVVDNATITFEGKKLSYTENDDGTITYILPEHIISAGAKDVSRELVLHIPESFISTGKISFTFDKVALKQHPYGFSKEFTHEELNEKETLDFDVRVGWAASAMSDATLTPNGHKALMGYLTEKDDNDMYGIEFKFEFNYEESAMKDFASKTDAKWSYYKDTVNRLDFVEGMTSIGDYAFPDFSKVTSVTFPSTIKDIGISAFDGSGLTGEVTIPASVTNIESLAFGNLPNVNIFTFEHTKNNLTLPDNTSSGNTKKGAFYVSSHVDTTVNTTVEEIMYGYRWHDGWDNRRLVPTLNAGMNWRSDLTDSTEYIPEDDTTIKTVTFADYYIPDGTETVWDASDSTVPGTVTAYLSEDGANLTLAGNGYGLIFANQDSSSVFECFYNLVSVEDDDIFDTRNAITMEYMFYDCGSLTSLDVSTWNVSEVITTASMFENAASLPSLDLSTHTETAKDGSGTYKAWDTKSLEDAGRMFCMYGADLDSPFALESVDVTGWDTTSLLYMNHMFMNNENLTEVPGLSEWYTTEVVTIQGLFHACYSLETIDVATKVVNEGKSNEYTAWDTGNVECTRDVFSICTSLKSIDVSDWDMSSVTDSREMFYYCSELTELTIPATLSVISQEFASFCPKITTFTFLQPADLDMEFPVAGSSKGAFYVRDNMDDDNKITYSTTNPLRTKVVTNNSDVLAYDWTTDRRGYAATATTVTGGLMNVSPSIAINGKTITLSPTADDRYTYDGATANYTENGTAKKITLEADELSFVMPAADVTITPLWEHDGLTYLTLKYMDDDTADETILYTGQTLPEPTRDGYTFDGWYIGEYTDTTKSPEFSSVDANCPWTQDANGVWSSTNVRGDSYKSTSDALSEEFTVRDDGTTISFDWWNDGLKGYSALGYDIYNVETGEYLSGKTSPTSTSCYKYIHPSTDYATESVELDKGTYQLLFMFNVNHNITVETTNKGYVKNIKVPYREYNYTTKAFEGSLAEDGMTLMAKWDEIEFPTLAASNTWYTGNTPQNTFTKINIVNTVDNYLVSSASESWPAAVDSDGDGINDSDIMCYVNGTTLTMVGDGSGKILTNPDSSWMFTSYDPENGMDVEDGFCNVTVISGLYNLDTRNTTNMEKMFYGCSGLKALDLSFWDTSNVTNMTSMFDYCTLIETIDLNNWDTSKVKWMGEMFKGCENLFLIDVGDFNTGSVQSMSAIFNGCHSLTTLDLSGWNTSKVKWMQNAFVDCNSLTTLDLSGWNTNRLQYMDNMFTSCDNLTTLDLSGWNTSNVTNMTRAFYNNNNLKTLYLSENFGQASNLPSSGIINGLSYTASKRDITVYGANDVMKAYDWAGDNRNVTFVDTLTLNVNSNGAITGFTSGE